MPFSRLEFGCHKQKKARKVGNLGCIATHKRSKYKYKRASTPQGGEKISRPNLQAKVASAPPGRVHPRGRARVQILRKLRRC